MKIACNFYQLCLRQKLRYLLVGALVASCACLTLADGQHWPPHSFPDGNQKTPLLLNDIEGVPSKTEDIEQVANLASSLWSNQPFVFQSYHLHNILMDQDYIATSFVDDCHNCGGPKNSMASYPYACWNIDLADLPWLRSSLKLVNVACFLQQVPVSAMFEPPWYVQHLCGSRFAKQKFEWVQKEVRNIT